MRAQRIKTGFRKRTLFSSVAFDLTYLQACDQEAAEKRRAEQAKREQLAKEKRRQDEALAVVSSRGRTDEPAKGAKGCRRIDRKECPYKVENS
jgi:hypothetical protein